MSHENDQHHHFEKSLWSRAEGPGLFTNLNFLLNRQRLHPEISKKQKAPKTILFMATCYYNEAEEELSGSLGSIKKYIDWFLNGIKKEKLEKKKRR